MKFLLLLSLLLPFFAFAGPSPDGAPATEAWFLVPNGESREVRICAESFDSDENAEIAKLTFYAYQAWLRYFFRDGPRRDAIEGEPLYPNVVKVLDRCDGSENLTFFYGVENDRVLEAKKLYDSPLAFAHRESFNETTGQGSGFLWVARAPEITFHRKQLTALLVHEMGHVFGNDHVSGTIMDENIAGILRSAYQAGSPLQPNIRGSHFRSDGPEAWVDLGREAMAWKVIRIERKIGTSEPGSELARALEFLTGEAVSDYDLRFHHKWNWLDETDNFTESGKGRVTLLTKSCKEPKEKPVTYYHEEVLQTFCHWQLKVEYANLVKLPMGDQQLFRRSFQGRTYSVPVVSSMQTGAIVREDGKRINFIVTRNIGGKLDFSLVRNGQKIRLF